jgi:hypothetical protein
MTSATAAAVTADGPAFEALIVYDTAVPGVTEATRFVFTIARSAVGFNVSLSVAALFPGVGSVTPAPTVVVAVFKSVPVAEGVIAVTTVKVAVVAAARSTVVLMAPLPDVAAHPAPAPGVHVHDEIVAPAGAASATIVPGAFDGPLLTTLIV